MAEVKWPGVTAKMIRRAKRGMRTDYGYDENKKQWRGPVVRRDPATYQATPRDCGLARCTNWTCRLWITSGCARCPHCHERQAAA